MKEYKRREEMHDVQEELEDEQYGLYNKLVDIDHTLLYYGNFGLEEARVVYKVQAFKLERDIFKIHDYRRRHFSNWDKKNVPST